MTCIADVRASEKEMLSAQDVAGVLHCHPQWLRQTAKENPERIGFHFTFIGARMIIPRDAFLAWADGREYRES